MQDGLIVNIGSIAGLEPMKSTPVYAASKWGLRGWSLSNYEVGLPQPEQRPIVAPLLRQSNAC